MVDLEELPDRITVFLRPFETFFKRQSSGGIVLLGATLIALILANSPAETVFLAFWEKELAIGFHNFGLAQSLSHWINDGLMAVFFFVVGLEIKREFLGGELATARKAALPIAAALGGMLLPALLYSFVAPDYPESKGWGVPMATDIAFALGVVALLGDKISRGMAIFLTALAIVDDLGAVLVIALFYSGDISASSLGAAAFFFGILLVGNRLDFQNPNFYALVGFCLWVAMLRSGVHASVAGVMIGAAIPVRPRHGRKPFLAKAETLMKHYKVLKASKGHFHDQEKLGTLLAMEHLCHDAIGPLQRMEHEMNAWVIYGVMPVFALANAGIHLSWVELQGAMTRPVTVGVVLGLVLGKPAGILLFSWLAVRLKLADLPTGASWREVAGVGILGGIGFTMSLFITNLAFVGPELIAEAKVGIFAASLLAGIGGYIFLSRGAARRHTSSPARVEDG